MQYILIVVGQYIAISIGICGVAYFVRGLNPAIAPEMAVAAGKRQAEQRIISNSLERLP
jgi:hypothetical protein